MAEHDKWRCTECDHICTEATMLEAPNPFCDTAAVHGCPECKAVEQFTRACDIEGCAQDASCGGPGSDGVYRTTCGKHADWLRTRGVPEPHRSCADGCNGCEQCTDYNSNPDGIQPGQDSPVRMDPGTGAWDAPEPEDEAGVDLPDGGHDAG